MNVKLLSEGLKPVQPPIWWSAMQQAIFKPLAAPPTNASRLLPRAVLMDSTAALQRRVVIPMPQLGVLLDVMDLAWSQVLDCIQGTTTVSGCASAAASLLRCISLDIATDLQHIQTKQHENSSRSLDLARVQLWSCLLLSHSAAVFRRLHELVAQRMQSPNADADAVRSHVATLLNGATVLPEVLLPFFPSFSGLLSTVEECTSEWALTVSELVVALLRSLDSLLSLLSSPSTTSVAESEDYRTYSAMVESPHPYPPASFKRHRAAFPPSVRFMIIELDPRCSTLNEADTVTLTGASECKLVAFGPRGNGAKVAWPSRCIIFPGNTVSIELQSASEDVAAVRQRSEAETLALKWGFRATVTGYAMAPSAAANGALSILHQVQHHAAYLGAACAEALIVPHHTFARSTTLDDALSGPVFERGLEPRYSLEDSPSNPFRYTISPFLRLSLSPA